MATNAIPITFSLLDQLIETEIEAGNTVMLLGEPGIGKSAWANALGAKNNMKVFVMGANDYADRQDVNGVKTICMDADTQTYAQKFFPTFKLHNCVEYANEHPTERVLLFIDELTRATPDVTSTLMQLQSDRRIGDTNIPDNVVMIIAGNDTGDITPLDTAKISRFALYKVEPDVQGFFAANPELFPAIKTVLTKHPSYLFTMQDISALSNSGDDDDDDGIGDSDEVGFNDEMNQFTTPRTITYLSNFLNVAQAKNHIQTLANTSLNDGSDNTLLDVALISKVGTTPFYLELKAEILNSIIHAPIGLNKTYLKPTSFDLCKAQATKDDLTKLIATLDSNTKCDLLIYALHDNQDNAVLVTELTKGCTKLDFTANKVSELTDLIKNKQANDYNLDILRNVDSKDSYATLIIDINNL